MIVARGSQVCILAASVIALLGAAELCRGQGAPAAGQFALDKVVVKAGSSNAEIVAIGRIVDYTGSGLTFRAKDGASTTTFSTEQVVNVETPQTPPHVAGLRAFAADQTDEAFAQFTKALEVETRSWVRREIRAMLVRCSLQQGDRAKAGLHFAELLRSDPATIHFKLIPLVWTSETPSEVLQITARGWLNNSSDAMRLIAASALLASDKDESRCRVELQRLATTTDPRIYWLAEAQLWRTRLDADNLDRVELDRWATRIQQIPAALRGGPYYVLGQGHLRLQEHERAAMSLLWVPLVYHDDQLLSAQACYEAAEALARIGQSAEANTLYRELTVRFRNTAYGAKAAEKLGGTNAPADSSAGEKPEAIKQPTQGPTAAPEK